MEWLSNSNLLMLFVAATTTEREQKRAGERERESKKGNKVRERENNAENFKWFSTKSKREKREGGRRSGTVCVCTCIEA